MHIQNRKYYLLHTPFKKKNKNKLQDPKECHERKAIPKQGQKCQWSGVGDIDRERETRKGKGRNAMSYEKRGERPSLFERQKVEDDEFIYN